VRLADVLVYPYPLSMGRSLNWTKKISYRRRDCPEGLLKFVLKIVRVQGGVSAGRCVLYCQNGLLRRIETANVRDFIYKWLRYITLDSLSLLGFHGAYMKNDYNLSPRIRNLMAPNDEGRQRWKLIHRETSMRRLHGYGKNTAMTWVIHHELAVLLTRKNLGLRRCLSPIPLKERGTAFYSLPLLALTRPSHSLPMYALERDNISKEVFQLLQTGQLQ